ncbi:MAG TPA: Fur family transcriptional regulator, partial [Clostridiales bacterium]|nr:Fur family transcriptional regulator [Clostridiales bacterium]
MDNSWDNICYERKIYNKDTILAELKEKGCRITKKRNILINIILKNECASCKEIHWEA